MSKVKADDLLRDLADLMNDHGVEFEGVEIRIIDEITGDDVVVMRTEHDRDSFNADDLITGIRGDYEKVKICS